MNDFLNVARELARTNPIKGLPRMAAVITRRNKIVSTGINKRKTHPLVLRFQKNEHAFYIHAELDAIINARGPVEGCDIHIARIYPDGSFGLAKPCKGCVKLLVAFSIKNVFHT